MVTMVWVVSRFRLKAPSGISSSYISPLTSSGQRSRAPWASQPQKSATLSPQPGGKPRNFIRTRGDIEGGGHWIGPSGIRTKVSCGLLQFLQAIQVSKANSLQLRPPLPPHGLSSFVQLFSAGVYIIQAPMPLQIILYRCA